MSNKDFTGLLVGKKNREIYKPLENDYYSNLTNGKIGRLKLEDAQRLFNIPIILNNMAEKNPLVLDLIENLGLSLEAMGEDEKKNILNNWINDLEIKK